MRVAEVRAGIGELEGGHGKQLRGQQSTSGANLARTPAKSEIQETWRHAKGGNMQGEKVISLLSRMREREGGRDKLERVGGKEGREGGSVIF